MNQLKKPFIMIGLFYFIIVSSYYNHSIAEEIPTLKTVDTKSPQDTLKSFIDATEQAFTRVYSIRNSYLRSSRLFLSTAEKNRLAWPYRNLSMPKEPWI